MNRRALLLATAAAALGPWFALAEVPRLFQLGTMRALRETHAGRPFVLALWSGKLSGKYKFRLFQGAPVRFTGQHQLNAILGIVMVGCGIWFAVTQDWTPFIIMTIAAFILGVTLIIPIGGADMPVVVSMLNSYSGWAAAGIGFSLNNSMLIVAPSWVQSPSLAP
ncbi:NAD(P)(+) transhydrogenase (Re/Si-specific) subunit beta [Mycobacterium tuberculosis]|uniref:NAD(P)(+) transhydrogenase (Re/Si-specific) subunit beta n=1 Tax=Mycobacterium tuberculosis TaxID=1773 RepID=UPI00272A65FA|nr:NAD(P)(+) transhydrogenase (Re/Si-specific) subunit beta [Mycobacterium tuberculosis]